jgi:hypothetical protein
MRNGTEFCTSYGDTLSPLQDLSEFQVGDKLRIDAGAELSTRNSYGPEGTSDNVLLVELVAPLDGDHQDA